MVFLTIEGLNQANWHPPCKPLASPQDSGSQPFLTYGTLKPRQSLCGTLRTKKIPLTEHLNPKILHFCMNFKVSKNLAEHLGPACGTLVFRGTVVGNHCPRRTSPPSWEPLVYMINHFTYCYHFVDVSLCPKVITLSSFRCTFFTNKIYLFQKY